MNNSNIQSRTKIRKETVKFRRTAVERVVRTMQENLDEPLTMPEMAKIAHFSQFHFNRIFHETTGIPPIQFLYALRLEAAKKLLLTTSKSITQICFEVGYNSLGTFTSRFTELVGLSPREFRQLGVKIRLFDWERLFREDREPPPEKKKKPVEPYLNGRLQAPADFEGLIFIGLFERMIPQNRPVGGTMLTRGGSFCIDSLPEGEFYLLSAALPRAADAREYLMPDFSKLLVGIGETPLRFKTDRVEGKTEVCLRRIQITDPPILLALPSLLAMGMKN